MSMLALRSLLRLSLVLLLGSCTGAPTPAVTNDPGGQARTLAGGGQTWRIDSTELLRVVDGRSATPRLYNVWATWCGPCVREMPVLKAFGETNAHIELWFVNVDHAGLPDGKIDAAIERFGIGAFHHVRPVVGEHDLTTRLGLTDVVPVTLIVGRDGQRLRAFTGRVSEADLHEVAAQVR